MTLLCANNIAKLDIIACSSREEYYSFLFFKWLVHDAFIKSLRQDIGRQLLALAPQLRTIPHPRLWHVQMSAHTALCATTTFNSICSRIHADLCAAATLLRLGHPIRERDAWSTLSAGCVFIESYLASLTKTMSTLGTSSGFPARQMKLHSTHVIIARSVHKRVMYAPGELRSSMRATYKTCTVWLNYSRIDWASRAHGANTCSRFAGICFVAVVSHRDRDQKP